MAALTTAAELDAVRIAIQTFTTSTSKQRVSVQLAGGLSVDYDRAQIDWLQSRERELMRRLSIRNTRKRTRGDFT